MTQETLANGTLDNAASKPDASPDKPANRLPDPKPADKTVKAHKTASKPADSWHGLRDECRIKWQETIRIEGYDRVCRFSLAVPLAIVHKPSDVAKLIETRTDNNGKPMDLRGKWSFARADGSSQSVAVSREPLKAAKAYRLFAGLPDRS